MDEGLILRVKNISKSLSGIKVLDDISFAVKKHTVHAFLGPNGAGKSTTMNIISGLLPQNSGEIFFQGTSLSRDQKITATEIGFLPEDLPIYGQMTPLENIKFVREIHQSFNKKYNYSLADVIQLCGVEEFKNKKISKLSKGMRQKLGLALTLCYEPDLIILDEPFVGLDPNALEEIKELILKLKEEHTFIISTHQLNEAKEICEPLTFIAKGKIIYNGHVQDVDLKKLFKEHQS